MSDQKIETSLLRKIPKVDDILHDDRFLNIARGVPRWIYMEAVREELDSLRRKILEGEDRSPVTRELDREGIIRRIERRISLKSRFSLRRVVNATGIIVHTNLGRAVLPEEAVERLTEAARNYTNLELDLQSGHRGSRHGHLKELITRLTGAEDALVVNNNAAAVLLTLNTLARGREVVVSRGELVEIGGSFRIPDIMARSGAILKEVGTTNKTHLADYEKAIGPQTALLLKVHTSNYRIVGFSHQPSLSELAALGEKAGVPVAEDLGSGCLVDLSPYGLGDEPLAGRSIEAGGALVTFSGDKLLGGPQAGIIIGRQDLIEKIQSNPLHRALRIDKFTAAALEATLRIYLEGKTAFGRIPVLKMISAGQSELRIHGQEILNKLKDIAPDSLDITLEDTVSRVGGGALPLQDIPSVALVLASTALKANEIEAKFRNFDPPIIGRILEERLLLDLRTMQEGDFTDIIRAVEHLKK